MIFFLRTLSRALFVCLAVGEAAAAEPIVRVGRGSYTTALPADAKEPPATIFRTERAAGPMPTNDWWSSLAWKPYSDRHFPHPLAVEAVASGLRVHYSGNQIAVSAKAIVGAMPPLGKEDLVLGHAEQSEWPDARVDGFSDWFVKVRFGAPEKSLTVSYGHGSPFVYALVENGGGRISFSQPPTVWSGGKDSAVLGVTINGSHYGLFGPSGSTWAGLGGKSLTNQSGGKNYLSLAVLPDKSEKTLELFRRYAYAHVTDTQVAWAYDPATAAVTTNYTFTTKSYEGSQEGTLFALYPHQWRNTTHALSALEYPSVRGVMKVAEGKSFRTVMRFPGVLPALPVTKSCDKERLLGFLQEEINAAEPPIKDSYWDGKQLGKIATLVPIADVYHADKESAALRKRLQQHLEKWLTADNADKASFYYNQPWGTLIGYPASFGSDYDLNDHHFHYGYFLKAAAELARHDPDWARDDQWGGMVKLLIRDIASEDRGDKRFPFLRNFDPYAGHTWAAGGAKFADGNNNESSSEAMNAWTGIILWGEATGDTRLRELGIYLYTTEMAAIQEYWFDIHNRNRPAGYQASVVTMVWGGKGVNETWFTANPEAVHGINWLPIHAGSLYLGHEPKYVEKNYQALIQENKGTQWDEWADLIWMYRALVDPQDAHKQFEAGVEKTKFEAGNSRANAYHWIQSLNDLGQVDASVTADYPCYAVFKNGARRTYCVYNLDGKRRTVTFSDGVKLVAEGKASATLLGK